MKGNRYYISILERPSFKDVRFVVYKMIHRSRLKCCYAELFGKMMWHSKGCCWIIHKMCKRFNLVNFAYNYRRLEYNQPFNYLIINPLKNDPFKHLVKLPKYYLYSYSNRVSVF